MPDSFTEVSDQSWFSRIKSAFAGILFGLILTVAAFPALTWNEKRAIDMTRTLKEGAKSVVSVPADQIDPAHEGTLVHFSGEAATPDEVEDADFGVKETGALKLRRTVETYQWIEEERRQTDKKVGGGTQTATTYTYRKGWDDELGVSSGFRHPEGHQNPVEKRFPNRTDVARPILVGAFRLPDILVGRISPWESLAPPAPETLPGGLAQEAILAAGHLYFGQDPASPVVGDTRVTFDLIRPHEISVVANQVGDTLEAFIGRSGAKLALLQPGIHSADAMFEQAHSSNRLTTWLLRLLFFVLMGLGISLLFRPLSVLADVVPLFGNIVGAGTGFVAFLLAGALSAITIAVAWLAFRPAISIPLLVLAVALFVGIGRRIRRARAEGPPPVPA